MAEAIQGTRAEVAGWQTPIEKPYPAASAQGPAAAAITDDRGWSSLPVAPWRRYGARAIDTSVNGLLGVLLLSYVWYALAPRSADEFFSAFAAPGGIVLFLMLAMFISAIVGGFIIGSTGTSLGKAIFGVRVLDRELQPIGIGRGLAREFHVFWRGMGFGIPVVGLFTMLAADRRLQRDKTTAWDRDVILVLHRPKGALQTTLNCIGVFLILLINALMRALGSI